MNIQKKFRQFLAKLVSSEKAFEKYKDRRLSEIRQKIQLRLVAKFLKNSLAKIHEERELQRNLQKLGRRRKGVTNTLRTSKRNEIGQPNFIESLSPLRQSDKLDYIPSIYSIFPAAPSKGKELTQSEKTQMQTESSCLRRQSICIKRISPSKLNTSEKISANIIEKDLLKKIKKSNKSKYAHILPNILGHTESSFNRENCDSSPGTPDFFQTEPRARVIHWNFLKSTASFENYKRTKVAITAKSTIFSTLSSRSHTPNYPRPHTMQIKR